jgi:2-oxoglutarate/2-oxoacid ferredoxin oxidoreductase subunit alpha
MEITMAAEINIMVGGEAGQGVQSVGFLMAKALARWGYHVFADQDYESRVRGGHNFFRVRAGDSHVEAINEALDILIALNKESIDLHRHEIKDSGVIIYDGEKITGIDGKNLVSIPMERLAKEAAGDTLMTNTVALGAALGLINFKFTILEELLYGFFSGETAVKNVQAAKAGYEYAQKLSVLQKKLTGAGSTKRMLLNGNEAMSIGAIAAGCKFMSAYPMTPITSIMEYLASRSEEYGLVMVPAEDEIAAINMVVGAAYTGVRAMTATSGGGFCLMVEGIGLAAMTETPIVVIEGQRPGPAIGLPTRTEQGDLEFILHASHGEFPRVVFAPATVDDCFWLTVKAFNLAEKYQLPVMIITDHYLANSYFTTDKFDLSKLTIDRGLLFTQNSAGDEYKRYALTFSGISPRAFPGNKDALVVADSDEHSEAGHIIEDAETRKNMMDKRLRKLNGLKQEIISPRFYGAEKADTLLIGWGSTYGVIKESVDILNKNGGSYCHLHLSQIWPFPVEAVASAMKNAHQSYVIENNATGQLAGLIRRETGLPTYGSILKYDGRPFTPEIILRELRK